MRSVLLASAVICITALRAFSLCESLVRFDISVLLSVLLGWCCLAGAAWLKLLGCCAGMMGTAADQAMVQMATEDYHSDQWTTILPETTLGPG